MYFLRCYTRRRDNSHYFFFRDAFSLILFPYFFKQTRFTGSRFTCYVDISAFVKPSHGFTSVFIMFEIIKMTILRIYCIV